MNNLIRIRPWSREGVPGSRSEVVKLTGTHSPTRISDNNSTSRMNYSKFLVSVEGELDRGEKAGE